MNQECLISEARFIESIVDRVLRLVSLANEAIVSRAPSGLFTLGLGGKLSLMAMMAGVPLTIYK